MTTDLEMLLRRKLAAERLALDPGAIREINNYTARYRLEGFDEEIVHAYLLDRAIRIAHVHGLDRLDEHAIRHAIWFYHQGSEFGNDCRGASKTILILEQLRVNGTRPLEDEAIPDLQKIVPEFSDYLDRLHALAHQQENRRQRSEPPTAYGK